MTIDKYDTQEQMAFCGKFAMLLLETYANKDANMDLKALDFEDSDSHIIRDFDVLLGGLLKNPTILADQSSHENYANHFHKELISELLIAQKNNCLVYKANRMAKSLLHLIKCYDSPIQIENNYYAVSHDFHNDLTILGYFQPDKAA